MHGSTSPKARHALRSLLVPLDLTAASDRVVDRVSLLATADGARVTLLHVVPDSLTPGERRKAVRDAEATLSEEVRHLRKRLEKKLELVPVVRVGSSAKEIAAAAAAVHADLIVMGRGGGRALRDTFLGSTAERVVRLARRPVLVVRLPARGAYRRPALALALDEAAREVVRLLLLVLPPPRPRVDVVHAVDVPFRGLVYPSLSAGELARQKDELQYDAARKLVKLLAKAVASASVRPEDAPVFSTRVVHGTPRSVVEKAASASATDLLVLGTRGHRGAAYLFLGTVAGDVLRAARCDVLVVPPAAAKK